MSIINFTGAGVTATRNGDTVTVDIPGGSVDSESPVSKIYFPPGTDSVFYETVNPDFIVYATATIHNDYSEEGSHTPPPPFGDVIVWGFRNQGYVSTFFTSISGDASTKSLIFNFPTVKNLLSDYFSHDEITVAYLLFYGTHKFLDHSEVFFKQSVTPTIRFIGNGSGSWTNDGIGYNSGVFINIVKNNGYGEVNFSPLIAAWPDQTGIQWTYSGPNNYHTKQWNNGAYGWGFYLLDSAGSIVNNPTTSDVVIGSGFGNIPVTVDCYQWKTYNNFWANISGATYTMIVECWFVASVNSSNPTTSIDLKWQEYTDATTHLPLGTGYKIYRGATSGGTLIYSGTGFSATDTGLTTKTIYTYSMYCTISGVDTLITTFKCATR